MLQPKLKQMGFNLKLMASKRKFRLFMIYLTIKKAHIIIKWFKPLKQIISNKFRSKPNKYKREYKRMIKKE